MGRLLDVNILPQPDDVTCGPTCLQAVYGYYGETIGLQQVIRETPMLAEGGTLAVLLALHALRRGYRATLLTYNLQIFDPTWFQDRDVDLRERLEAQAEVKQDAKLHFATKAYLEYLDLGGAVRFETLSPDLLRRYLKKEVPILTGLSATYLYDCAREIGETNTYDDIRGAPSGHFVVLSGYDREERTVRVADPYLPNPVAGRHYYDVPIQRLIGAIFLGIVTYDANLLVLEPRNP